MDEVGRGCLAGAVLAAAVILDPLRPIEGLRDSKKLSAAQREALALQVRERALAWHIGRAEVDEIDRLNIHHASLLAMRRAIEGLSLRPERVMVDGRHVPPGLAMPAEALVGGDDLVPAIAAASILAKVQRDEEMRVLDALLPQYGFATHKAYPVAAHLAALQRHGPSIHHRQSYAPVKRALQSLRGD